MNFVAMLHCGCLGLKGEWRSTWRGICNGLLNKKNITGTKNNSSLEWLEAVATLYSLLACCRSSTGIPLQPLFSLSRAMNVVPRCHNLGRQVACFGDSCKVTRPGMLGMSIIQENTGGISHYCQNVGLEYSDLTQYNSP